MLTSIIIVKMEFRHSTNFQKLFKLFLENKMTDTTLVAGENKSVIKCHKLVLIATSTYFEELFELIGNHEDSNNTTIVLRDISQEFLMKILELVYNGKVNLSDDQISGFKSAAAYLNIKLEDANETLLDCSLQTEKSQETIVVAMSQETIFDAMSQDPPEDEIIQDLSMNSPCLIIQEEIKFKGKRSDASRNTKVLLSRNKNLEIEPQLKKSKKDLSKELLLISNHQRKRKFIASELELGL